MQIDRLLVCFRKKIVSSGFLLLEFFVKEGNVGLFGFIHL